MRHIEIEILARHVLHLEEVGRPADEAREGIYRGVREDVGT
jgi:hypothetical protein